MEKITSKSNNLIKEVKKLFTSRKFRNENQKFVLEGVRLCFDVTESDCGPCTLLLTEAAAEKYGTVDVVVNNAQAIVPSAPVEDTTYENMLKAWQSGVIGALNYMQAAFPYMKAQHEGRIINFASATGMFGIAGQLAYGSNKEAIRGMTKIAAKEWGQYGICVNVVLPGAESPAAKAWAQKFPEEYAKQVNLNPMKRFGDPENDIAPVVAFLAGPDSCYYSGQSVIVDGANSIMP